MTLVNSIDKIVSWLTENVCSKITLKLPDDYRNDTGYDVVMVNPADFAQLGHYVAVNYHRDFVPFDPVKVCELVQIQENVREILLYLVFEAHELTRRRRSPGSERSGSGIMRR